MSRQAVSKEKISEAIKIFKLKGGILRTSEAIKEGIHPRTLYCLRDSNIIDQLSRGVFRLVEMPSITEPDLAIIALRIPTAVICLVSALAFHELTTQIPHTVSIALKKGAETPRIDFPPVTVHRFSKAAYEAGVEERYINGIKFKIYSPGKTVADCFKARNKIGMDIVLEALKTYRTKDYFDPDELIEYAQICRVSNVIKPYLEAIL
jgi:predicted transcriptional regulator of viral defense system